MGLIAKPFKVTIIGSNSMLRERACDPRIVCGGTYTAYRRSILSVKVGDRYGEFDRGWVGNSLWTRAKICINCKKET